MAQYLSPEWFAEMEQAAQEHTPEETGGRAVRLREIITGSPYGEVTYTLSIEDGALSISREVDAEAPATDVTFTQDYETAAALHRAELTTQEAFFSGRVGVAGHLNTLLDNADLLQGVAPAFAEVRAKTTY